MFFKALILSFAIESGFVSGGLFNYSERSMEWKDIGSLYTTMESDVSFGPAYVGGEIISYFVPKTLVNYSPFQITFIARAGLDFGNFQLGYEHSCFHPMQPYATVIGNEMKPKYEGGYNKFFVRIETGKGASQ